MSPRFRPADWYDTPHYYDIVFGTDTVRECDFLESMRRRHATTQGKQVLEPACGSGRLVEEMAQRGYAVTGFDLNRRMLAYARSRVARARVEAFLRVAALADFRFRTRFDLVHCLVSTFKYLPSERQARSHLECVSRSLRRGGIYVLGFHLSEYDAVSKTRERWVAARDGTNVVCNTQFWPPVRRRRTERVRTRLTVQQRGETLHLETNWTFRTYDATQVRRLLRSVPSLEHVATYDFTYQVDRERDLDDEQLDVVLVLRRT